MEWRSRTPVTPTSASKRVSLMFSNNASSAISPSLLASPPSPSQSPRSSQEQHTELCSSTPKDFECPISHTIMCDPVLCADGFSYERSMITEWFGRNNTSPMTGEKLAHKQLVANNALRTSILLYVDETANTTDTDANTTSDNNNNNNNNNNNDISTKKPQLVRSEEVNTRYPYDARDIREILTCRLLDANERRDDIDVCVLETIDCKSILANNTTTNDVMDCDNDDDERALADCLEQEMYKRGEHSDDERLLLIPCRLSSSSSSMSDADDRWAGIYVELKGASSTYAHYVDHVDDEREADGENKRRMMASKLQRQLTSVYTHAVFASTHHHHHHFTRPRSDSEDSGDKDVHDDDDEMRTAMSGINCVEDLVLLVQNRVRAERQLSVKEVRKMHLNALKAHNPAYYEHFLDKQNAFGRGGDQDSNQQHAPSEYSKPRSEENGARKLSQTTPAPGRVDAPRANQLLASVSGDNMMHVWRLDTGECVRTFAYDRPNVDSLELLGGAGGDLLAILCKDYAIKVRDFARGECEITLSGHLAEVCVLTLFSDRRLASGAADKTVKLWCLDSAECVRTLHGHSNWISALKRVSANRLASGSCDTRIKVWRTDTGECLRTLIGHTGWIMSLEMISLNRLASASCDQTVRIWSWTRGECIRTLAAHTSEVLVLRFLPALNWLASAGKDNAICVWNMSNARRVRRLCGHTDWVQCLELCAGGGGKWLASGSNDATLRVWNVESGECVRKMVGHRSYISSLAIGNGERSPSETNRGCSIS